MSDRKMQFKIDAEGNLSILEVNGYGSGCTMATKIIESIGQVDESSRVLTDEINEEVSQENHQRTSA